MNASEIKTKFITYQGAMQPSKVTLALFTWLGGEIFVYRSLFLKPPTCLNKSHLLNLHLAERSYLSGLVTCITGDLFVCPFHEEPNARGGIKSQTFVVIVNTPRPNIII